MRVRGQRAASHDGHPLADECRGVGHGADQRTLREPAADLLQSNAGGDAEHQLAAERGAHLVAVEHARSCCGLSGHQHRARLACDQRLSTAARTPWLVASAVGRLEPAGGDRRCAPERASPSGCSPRTIASPTVPQPRTPRVPSLSSMPSDLAQPGTRPPLGDARRIVVKLGTQVVTHDGRSLALGRLMSLVEEMALLRQQGRQILLVSSGAVALGMKQLGLTERPRSLGPPAGLRRGGAGASHVALHVGLCAVRGHRGPGAAHRERPRRSRPRALRPDDADAPARAARRAGAQRERQREHPRARRASAGAGRRDGTAGVRRQRRAERAGGRRGRRGSPGAPDRRRWALHLRSAHRPRCPPHRRARRGDAAPRTRSAPLAPAGCRASSRQHGSPAGPG